MKAFALTDSSQRAISDLAIIDIPKPKISANDVLVKVTAVGLNPIDFKVIENGVDTWTFPHIVGMDVVGEIVELGEHVTQFQIGDRVAGHGNLTKQGCLAEFASVPAYQLTKIPDSISHTDAAALLCNGLTAYQALFRKVTLANKKTILIHAGSGGVGSIAIQLAKMVGLTVYTTASTAKFDFVKSLGADVVIDYKTENVSRRIAELTDGLGVDMIINTIGKDESTEDLKRLAYNGSLIAIVSPPRIDNPSDLFSRALSIDVLNLGGAHLSHNPQQAQDLATMTEELFALVQEQKVKALVSQTFPFEETKEALQLIKDQKITGKLVVDMILNHKRSETTCFISN